MTDKMEANVAENFEIAEVFYSEDGINKKRKFVEDICSDKVLINAIHDAGYDVFHGGGFGKVGDDWKQVSYDIILFKKESGS